MNNDALERREFLRREALLGGGPHRVAEQHRKGKKTARERLALLLDEGSFQETGMFAVHESANPGLNGEQILGDGVVTGTGRIHGRTVCVFSQDFTVFGGSLSETHARKITRMMDLAMQIGCPIIGLNDSGGARIQEGVASLGGYAEIFLRNTLASGVVPQISAILGPCAGGAVYSPAITDVVFMVRGISSMFVTGPGVVESVTHQKVTTEDLGGTAVHAAKSGAAHVVCDDEVTCLEAIRTVLEYLPDNFREEPKVSREKGPAGPPEEIAAIIPDNPGKPYDMLQVIDHIVDGGSFFELQREFAGNILCGFARIGGRPVGVVANQPAVLAGVLDIDSSRKAARFVRLCDAFNVPLVTLVDVPGFLPGTDQEWRGIIVNGAKLLYAYCEATVPRVTVITRKAYGGAYDVMSSKHIRGDFNFAWPSAEIAVMGPRGAAEIIFRREIASAPDPAAALGMKEQEYREKFATPYQAAGRGFVDEVIDPRDTRQRILQSLQILENKVLANPAKRHGNIPL